MTVPFLRGIAAVLVALGIAAVPAWAQGFGQAQGENPPLAFGQQPGAPPNEPAGPPQQGQPPYSQPSSGGMPSLLGLWSGQRFDQGGPIQQTDFFGQDGSFVSAARLANGVTIRVWGGYRVTQTGPTQLSVNFQVQGWLPRQICRQAPGMNPICTPFQLPQSDTSLVTFFSPTAFQSVSQTIPGAAITEQRETNPGLLQVQVPQQVLITMPAPVYQAPVAPNPGVGYRPAVPTGPKCDDLQQRRICNINDGHLVPSGGCLVCVSP